MTHPSVLIMAAGTGGHIFPALAVARILQAEQYQVHWLSTPAGMENDVLSGTDVQLHKLPVSGLRGKSRLSMLKAPFMLMSSVWRAVRLLRSYRPCCVIGFGGYVAGPGGVAAWLTRTPLIIHEQNAIAGTTNRLLVPFAKRVLESFRGTFPGSSKTICTGNPVRADIARMSVSTDQYDGQRELRLLVLGGSLGAAWLNSVMVEFVSRTADANIKVRHQCGRQKFVETEQAYASAGLAGSDRVRLMPFIDDMGEVLQWADLVVCRAGAGTLAELAIAGLPSVLVPFPHAIDDHQTANAKHLVEAGAAVMYQQKDLNVDMLVALCREFLAEPARLAEMAVAARRAAMPDASQRVASICKEVCHG